MVVTAPVAVAIDGEISAGVDTTASSKNSPESTARLPTDIIASECIAEEQDQLAAGSEVQTTTQYLVTLRHLAHDNDSMAPGGNHIPRSNQMTIDLRRLRLQRCCATEVFLSAIAAILSLINSATIGYFPVLWIAGVAVAFEWVGVVLPCPSIWDPTRLAAVQESFPTRFIALVFVVFELLHCYQSDLEGILFAGLVFVVLASALGLRLAVGTHACILRETIPGEEYGTPFAALRVFLYLTLGSVALRPCDCRCSADNRRSAKDAESLSAANAAMASVTTVPASHDSSLNGGAHGSSDTRLRQQHMGKELSCGQISWRAILATLSTLLLGTAVILYSLSLKSGPEREILPIMGVLFYYLIASAVSLVLSFVLSCIAAKNEHLIFWRTWCNFVPFEDVPCQGCRRLLARGYLMALPWVVAASYGVRLATGGSKTTNTRDHGGINKQVALAIICSSLFFAVWLPLHRVG